MTSPVFAQPGTSRTYDILGDRVTILMGEAETGGTHSVVRLETPPGAGPPPHVHANEDETFLVLEGTLSFFHAGSWTDVGAGGSVFLPRGVAHTFRNRTATPVRSIVIATPSGLERFFIDVGEAFAGKPVDPERLVELSARHGITYPEVGAPV